MKPDLLSKLSKIIEKHNMIDDNSKILVALSGGADSVCLLVCLNMLKDKYNAEVFAVHVNHNLRDNAKHDERFVTDLCKEMNITLATHLIDIKKEAKSHRISEELAGRKVRYRIFNEEAERNDCNLIATGHNKNDNAETVFINIVRGSGILGLCGIPPVRGKIIRPLIELNRSEIEMFLREHNIKYRNDETNLNDIYYRNKVRNLVFPFIEKNLSSDLTANLNRLSYIVKDDNDFLTDETNQHYIKCRTENGINLEQFNNLHDAIKRRIIRILYENSTGNAQNLEFVHIESVLTICKKDMNKSINLPGGFIANRIYNELFIYKQSNEATEFCYDLIIDEPLFIPELGKTVKVSADNAMKPQFNFADAKLNNPLRKGVAPPTCKNNLIGGAIINTCTKAFSCDIMKVGMKIRSRLPGDRIYLSEIKGHKKISDYFIDNKIPRSLRSKIPLLTIGSDVLWIMDEKGMTSGKYFAENPDKKIYVLIY